MSRYSHQVKPASIVDLAYSVADLVGGNVNTAPEFDLKDLSERRVVAVPINSDLELAGRGGSLAKTMSVQVGVLKRVRPQAGGIESPEVLDLIAFSEQLERQCIGQKIGVFTCVRVARDGLYDSDLLRSRGQFISVFTATFRALENACTNRIE